MLVRCNDLWVCLTWLIDNEFRRFKWIVSMKWDEMRHSKHSHSSSQTTIFTHIQHELDESEMRLWWSIKGKSRRWKWIYLPQCNQSSQCIETRSQDTCATGWIKLHLTIKRNTNKACLVTHFTIMLDAYLQRKEWWQQTAYLFLWFKFVFYLRAENRQKNSSAQW